MILNIRFVGIISEELFQAMAQHHDLSEVITWQAIGQLEKGHYNGKCQISSVCLKMLFVAF